MAVAIMVSVCLVWASIDRADYKFETEWLKTRIEVCANENKSLSSEIKELHQIVEQARYLTSCMPTSNNKIMLCVAEEEN